MSVRWLRMEQCDEKSDVMMSVRMWEDVGEVR